MASDAKRGIVAVRNLLVAKGAISKDEFDGAVDKVEAEQKTLFALDPDIRDAMEKIRRILRGE